MIYMRPRYSIHKAYLALNKQYGIPTVLVYFKLFFLCHRNINQKPKIAHLQVRGIFGDKFWDRHLYHDTEIHFKSIEHAFCSVLETIQNISHSCCVSFRSQSFCRPRNRLSLLPLNPELVYIKCLRSCLCASPPPLACSPTSGWDSNIVGTVINRLRTRDCVVFGRMGYLGIGYRRVGGGQGMGYGLCCVGLGDRREERHQVERKVPPRVILAQRPDGVTRLSWCTDRQLVSYLHTCQEIGSAHQRQRRA
ncbi:hypothetical protein EDD18DRAFT_54987 [Armillaria luteobubalina]|uniref:Uncharacterized protein n=1 Tax=Armillaria luteobubalina TaxID=153913 RepID=A0AA39UQE4_9AGAR|nr:hypothetical protein EDD18DRAFT_54987 [Armillaria luteobubalina]